MRSLRLKFIRVVYCDLTRSELISSSDSHNVTHLRNLWTLSDSCGAIIYRYNKKKPIALKRKVIQLDNFVKKLNIEIMMGMKYVKFSQLLRRNSIFLILIVLRVSNINFF